MSTRIYNINKVISWNPDLHKMDSISNIEILISNGHIQEISQSIQGASNNIDAQNCIITPGLIDSHTHPIFIGNRANEFTMRCSGKTYQEITANGGGIITSVDKLRNATEDELFISSLKNIKSFIKHGTTVLEAKSGYGLSVEDELKSLRVIRRLNEISILDIIPTFLGAHAIPPEYENAKEKYIKIICNEMIPKIAEEKLAVFCDVFCEEGYYNAEESYQILDTAKKHGLTPRIHADEFKDSGGAILAGKIGAISADHLMAINNSGIQSLYENNVIATLLPGTTLFLGNQNYADGRKLIDSGVDVALATDFNPGSSTINSLTLIMSLAVLNCGLTPMEAIKGVTWNAARSLKCEKIFGRIASGYQADLIFWDVNEIEEIPYWIGDDKINRIIKKGISIE